MNRKLLKKFLEPHYHTYRIIFRLKQITWWFWWLSDDWLMALWWNDLDLKTYRSKLEMVFCCWNCSDLLRGKNVLVICKILWIFVAECFFISFFEDTQIKYICWSVNDVWKVEFEKISTDQQGDSNNCKSSCKNVIRIKKHALQEKLEKYFVSM